jgi:hypothetical protein
MEIGFPLMEISSFVIKNGVYFMDIFALLWGPFMKNTGSYFCIFAGQCWVGPQIGKETTRPALDRTGTGYEQDLGWLGLVGTGWGAGS